MEAMNTKRMDKLEQDITNYIKRKCPCGHSVEVYHDKRICTHCGRLVFKNKEDEFKYRLNQQMKKNKD